MLSLTISLNGCKSEFSPLKFHLSFRVILLASSFVFTDVIAVNMNMSFAQNVLSSSNILHLPDYFPKEALELSEEVISTSTVNIKLVDDSTEVDTSFDLVLNYLDYQEEKFIADTSRATLKASFLWTITPKHYSWYFEESYTQTQKDPLIVSSEANVQNVNQFVTGPEFEWVVGDSMLHLDSYLTDYNFSETDNDNVTVVSTFKWGKKMPSGMTFDVTYSTKIVSYEESDIYNDYSQYTAGVDFKYKKKLNSFDVFYGLTELDKDGSNDDSFTNARLTFKRQMSRSSSFTLNHTNKLSDSSGSLDEFGTPLNDVFVDNKTTLAYTRSSSAFGLSLQLEERSKKDIDEYLVDEGFNQNIVLTRRLAARSQLQISYSDRRRIFKKDPDQFAAGNYEDNFYESKVEYSKRLSNRMSFKIFVSDLFVKSTDINRQYNDKKAGFTFSISR